MLTGAHFSVAGDNVYPNAHIAKIGSGGVSGTKKVGEGHGL